MATRPLALLAGALKVTVPPDEDDEDDEEDEEPWQYASLGAPQDDCAHTDSVRNTQQVKNDKANTAAGHFFMISLFLLLYIDTGSVVRCRLTLRYLFPRACFIFRKR
jgi:hypothetical protein